MACSQSRSGPKGLVEGVLRPDASGVEYSLCLNEDLADFAIVKLMSAAEVALGGLPEAAL